MELERLEHWLELEREQREAWLGGDSQAAAILIDRIEDLRLVLAGQVPTLEALPLLQQIRELHEENTVMAQQALRKVLPERARVRAAAVPPKFVDHRG